MAGEGELRGLPKEEGPWGGEEGGPWSGEEGATRPDAGLSLRAPIRGTARSSRTESAGLWSSRQNAPGGGEGGKEGGTREEPPANCVFVLVRGWGRVVVGLVSWDVVRVVWYDVVLRVVLGAIPCVVSNNRVLWCFVLCRLYNLICGEVEW